MKTLSQVGQVRSLSEALEDDDLLAGEAAPQSSSTDAFRLALTDGLRFGGTFKIRLGLLLGFFFVVVRDGS